MLHAIYVNDQHHGPLSGSYGVPPLFATHDAVLAEDYMGIVKNVCRTLERDATVIQLVDPVLFAVPFKSHRYTKCITLTGGSQRSSPASIVRRCGAAISSPWVAGTPAMRILIVYVR